MTDDDVKNFFKYISYFEVVQSAFREYFLTIRFFLHLNIRTSKIKTFKSVSLKSHFSSYVI